ncbi:MAG: BON domain-containing protein [Cytophagales bacterium]|nr:BON domain-containing protein [Cytophagales bacterium]
MKKLLLTALTASLVTTGLSGCFTPLLVGGAFVGGVMMSTDRRTTGTQIEDEGIELRASSRVREVLVERAHVNITSYNRQVLLTGEVPTEQDKAAAEQAVAKVENVKSVTNELAVLGNSTLTARSSDTLVTSRVKAALVDDKALYANAFKIVTERGIVYMMGRVTQREADLATAVVRGQSGVQKVVRLLEIISDEELKRLQPTPAPQAETISSPVMTGSGKPLTTSSPK